MKVSKTKNRFAKKPVLTFLPVRTVKITSRESYIDSVIVYWRSELVANNNKQTIIVISYTELIENSNDLTIILFCYTYFHVIIGDHYVLPLL